MHHFFILLFRELQRGWRLILDGCVQAAFFLMIAALFPLAVGPAPNKLAELAAALIWIAALLSLIPAFDRLFSDDLRLGWVEQVMSCRIPVWIYVWAKLVSWYLLSLIPFLIILPVLGVMMGLDREVWPVLMLSLALGMGAILLLGGMSAGLSTGARRSAMLLAILVLPLTLPVLVFGVMATEAALQGLSPWPHLKLLGAAFLFFAVICPPATQLALKSAIEDR